MDNIRKDTAQHIEDICQMKLEVSQMQGKAALESHEAVSLQCQCAIFQTILNLLFPKLASTIPTITMPLNAKPPTPFVLLPFLCQITPRRTKNDIAIGED